MVATDAKGESMTTTVIDTIHRNIDGQPVTLQLRRVGNVDSAYWYMVYRDDLGKLRNKYLGKQLPAWASETPATPPTCLCCGATLPAQTKGKRRTFCGDACKMKHHRQTKSAMS